MKERELLEKQKKCQHNFQRTVLRKYVREGMVESWWENVVTEYCPKCGKTNQYSYRVS